MGTNKKQTAVDILHSQMMGLICNNELSDREKVTMGHNLFYENKQMEREQIVNAWKEDRVMVFLDDKCDDLSEEDIQELAKKYYEETYGN